MQKVVYNDLFTDEPATVKSVVTKVQKFMLANYREQSILEIPCRNCRHSSHGGTKCLKFGTKAYPLKVDPAYTCDTAKERNISGQKKKRQPA